MLSILSVRDATVRGRTAHQLRSAFVRNRPVIVIANCGNGSRSGWEVFLDRIFSVRAVRSEHVGNCFEADRRQAVFIDALIEQSFVSQSCISHFFGSRHWNVNVFENLSRGDADHPIGGLDQIVALASMMLASERSMKLRGELSFLALTRNRVRYVFH